MPSWGDPYLEQLFTCIARGAISWEHFSDNIAMGDPWDSGTNQFDDFRSSSHFVSDSLEFGGAAEFRLGATRVWNNGSHASLGCDFWNKFSDNIDYERCLGSTSED